MAARENQGYLIAVICLTLLSLVLALATFLAASKASQYFDGQTTSELALQKEKNVSEAYRLEADVLRSYIGLEGTTIQSVQTTRDQLENVIIRADDKDAINPIKSRVNEAVAKYEEDMNCLLYTSPSPRD